MLNARVVIDMLTQCFQAPCANPDDHSIHHIKVFLDNLLPPLANQEGNQNREL